MQIMNKKKIIIIILIIVGALVIAGLYGTFASSTTSESDNEYAITLTGSTGEVVVPAGKSKTVIYQITNTNKGIVQYGVAYSGNNINAKYYTDSPNYHTGTIDYGENKFVKLRITNTGTSDSTATIKAILGYENGGSLDSLITSGYSLVNKGYRPSINFISFIKKQYTTGNQKLITQPNSNDTYINSYQDTNETWGLMNDGVKVASLSGTGATTITNTTVLTSGAEGNIRYFGPRTSVNNYIYFNCSDYNNQSDSTCEKWRIIGIVDGKVKIISDENIGNIAWDQDKNQDSSKTTFSNNWETSSLQLMLNNSYFYGDTAGKITYYSGGSSWLTTTVIDMSAIGIKNNATREMISESTWYLGGYGGYAIIYAREMYSTERKNTVGTTIYSGNSFTITANIGLLYVSDYGYATDLAKCGSNLHNYSSNTDSYACRTNNWLYNGTSSMWFITHDAKWPAIVFNAADNGYVNRGNVEYYSHGVYPSLYLNPELSIELDHEGTSTDPYRISLS